MCLSVDTSQSTMTVLGGLTSETARAGVRFGPACTQISRDQGSAIEVGRGGLDPTLAHGLMMKMVTSRWEMGYKTVRLSAVSKYPPLLTLV